MSDLFGNHIVGFPTRRLKCSGIKDTLCPGPDFNRVSCLSIANPIDGTDKMDVEVGDEIVEHVA